MSGGAVLNRSRVAGSALAGQTQNREQHHADVRCDLSRFTKATPCPNAGAATCAPQRRTRGRGGTLFLRLGGKLQRIAVAAAGVRAARGVWLCDVPGV